MKNQSCMAERIIYIFPSAVTGRINCFRSQSESSENMTLLESLKVMPSV